MLIITFIRNQLRQYSTLQIKQLKNRWHDKTLIKSISYFNAQRHDDKAFPYMLCDEGT